MTKSAFAFDAGLAGERLTVQGRTIATIFRSWVERTPDKTFLIWAPFDGEPETYSYARFWALSERVAAGLGQLGVKRGSRFLLHMENSPEFLLTWLASARIGAVAVTTNTNCSADEVAYFVGKAGAVGAITQGQFADRFSGLDDRLSFLVTCGISDAGIPFERLTNATGPAPLCESGPLDDLSVQFTSGTTARPKGVVWSHANAVWAAQTNARHFGIRHDDVCQTFLPLFHTNAQSYSLLATIWTGSTMLLQPRFSASHFWEPSVRHGATWASLIPFCVKAAIGQPIPDNHKFRLWVPAVALPELVDQPLGIPTMGLWGMTETVTQGIVGDPHHAGPQMCIGRAAPGYDIALRREDGALAIPGESGRLFIRGVRGVTLFKEYLDDPDATAAAFDEDGWFETGDIVRADESGNLFFMDRDKDMLKVGGENVAASEVEAVIMATGLVREVAVVGQKHAMLDEVPVAFVIPGANPPDDLKAQLITACRAKLAGFKAIRDVFIVDDLPRATLQKVAKNILRDRLDQMEAGQNLRGHDVELAAKST